MSNYCSIGCDLLLYNDGDTLTAMWKIADRLQKAVETHSFELLWAQSSYKGRAHRTKRHELASQWTERTTNVYKSASRNS